MRNGDAALAQSKGITDIQNALKENKPETAQKILHFYTEQYISRQQPDSLVKYIFYTGQVTKAINGVEAARKKVDGLVDKIKDMPANPSTLRQACIEAGEFYGAVGMNTRAYKLNEEALSYTRRMAGKSGNELAQVENNLATYAQRMGNIDLSTQHGRKALAYLLSGPKPDYETLYIAYNGMGALMWYASKTDSSLYFFSKALQALEKTERTAKNKFYRPAIVQNNLSGLYELQGRTTQAITALENAIDNIRDFLASNEPDVKKQTAITFQFEAIDNLAGFYKELGNYQKAQELLEYSYQQKQKILSPDDPAIFISQILLGQLYFAKRNYDKATQFLSTGLKKISSSDGDYLFWQADACNSLALLHHAKQDEKKAAFYYEKADSLYQESLQGSFDNIYLDFLRNSALFYAENNEPELAKKKATKGYEYVVKSQGTHSLIAFYQLLNLAEVYYLSGNYAASKKYSEKSLAVVDDVIRSSKNLMDSIRMELKKPKAILQKSKAGYQLLTSKNRQTLTPIWNELHEALSVLERQKTILEDPADINMVLADNTDLIEFIKKITLELYNITHEEKYIDELMSFHESALYNRIRSRLDKNDSIQFANIPTRLQNRERQLKSAMTAALKGSGSHDEKMNRYTTAIKEWDNFQKQLRTTYPRYYKMRYASIFKSTDRFENFIPSGTTVIRYFFIEKNLYALVADNRNTTLFELGQPDFGQSISELSENRLDDKQTARILFFLYQKLWRPFANNITGKKVVVIPDGILNNLNFELLTPVRITSYKDLATKSLLSKYTFSYNYSLFLLDASPARTTALENNFVAFAPGFSDEIKSQYRRLSKDSFRIDKAYLSLLPQPFSITLATRLQELFGGKTFINESSSKSSFKQNAGNNHIIHIGTHAESDNDHPEFSRLIFAKNISEGDDDNSLYVDEIYNCNLSSELAVLTACESGRPGYRDGEGMISLAHAFNYAGSQSIVTGLWKIDEQASSLLLDAFYKNLLAGMDKDDALQKAKLNYLEQAEGRMLTPQYWAGLVIMGDTSPVNIQVKSRGTNWTILAAGLIFFCAGIFFYYLKKAKKSGISR